MSDDTAVEHTRFHIFICQRCDERLPFLSTYAYLKHAEHIHKISLPIHADVELVRSMDGDDWFQNDYQWTLKGLLLCYEIYREARKAK